MIRRKLTLKRVDPWSVLKFGFVVNVALLLVGLLAFWILWLTVRRLGLIEQFCGSVGTIVLDLQECSVNGGNIFRTVLFLGVLGVVVQTGIVVFGAFLYNLIADLTGGLTFSFLDESGDAVLTSAKTARADESSRRPTGAAGSSTGGGSSGGGSSGDVASRGSSSAGSAAAGAAAAGGSRSGPGPSHDTGAFRPTGSPRSSERPGPPASRGAGSASTGDRPPPRPPQDADRGQGPQEAPRSSRGADQPTPGAPSSPPSGPPSSVGQSPGDRDTSTSAPDAAGDRRPGPDEAQAGDEDEDRDRPQRPSSGSSLWGDPTRSRE